MYEQGALDEGMRGNTYIYITSAMSSISHSYKEFRVPELPVEVETH